MTDAVFDAIFLSNDWFAQIGVAEAWAKAASALEPVDAGAARIAWSLAAHGYRIYCDAYDAHLPASRWDYDYGRECAEAETKARELPERPPSDALSEWGRLVLSRRFSDALALVTARPEGAAERALLAVVVLALHHAGRKDDAERLAPWCS
jgi:hypothetical protein